MTSAKCDSFRQILEDARTQAAEAAWARAAEASKLRHLMLMKRHFAAAQRFGEMKQAALKRAVGLVPEQIKVTIDDEYHVGLLSVRWAGRGRYHLPIDADIQPQRQQQQRQKFGVGVSKALAV